MSPCGNMATKLHLDVTQWIAAMQSLTDLERSIYIQFLLKSWHLIADGDTYNSTDEGSWRAEMRTEAADEYRKEFTIQFDPV